MQSKYCYPDGCLNALENLSYDKESSEILKRYESRIDFSALVNLKNDVEELIDKKTRK